MILIGSVIGVGLLLLLLLPFFVGPGGLLAHGAKIDSVDQLRAIKKAILKRYLEEEGAQRRGDLSGLAWRGRQEFLVHRYVDAARRLDYLEGQVAQKQVGAP